MVCKELDFKKNPSDIYKYLSTDLLNALVQDRPAEALFIATSAKNMLIDNNVLASTLCFVHDNSKSYDILRIRNRKKDTIAQVISHSVVLLGNTIYDPIYGLLPISTVEYVQDIICLNDGSIGLEKRHTFWYSDRGTRRVPDVEFLMHYIDCKDTVVKGGTPIDI